MLITRDINQNRQYIKLTDCTISWLSLWVWSCCRPTSCHVSLLPSTLHLKAAASVRVHHLFQCSYSNSPQIISEPHVHTLYQIRKSSEIFVDPKMGFREPSFILYIQLILTKGGSFCKIIIQRKSVYSLNHETKFHQDTEACGVSEHPLYRSWSLHTDDEGKKHHYISWLETTKTPKDIGEIRPHVFFQLHLGSRQKDQAWCNLIGLVLLFLDQWSQPEVELDPERHSDGGPAPSGPITTGHGLL